ncbi:MAG: antitoxin VapB family protein [Thermoplasmataceae archaeon]|jgi:predicted CopG family antitoxin
MKNVTISDKIYEEISSMKRPGESFSEVIGRLVYRKRVKLSSFYGILADSEFLKELEKEVDENRKKSLLREFQ